KFRFKNKLMSLDGSIVELSATMFDWAKYRQRKGAIKLHLLVGSRRLSALVRGGDRRKI
ncbi:ISPg4, transposase, partial [mine drainage metagenome]